MGWIALFLTLLADAGRREHGFRPVETALLRAVPLGQGRAYAVAFSPDGRRLAAGGGDGSTAVLDAFTLRELRRLKGHEGGVYGLAFSADGRRLVTTGARDCALRVWDVASGELLREIRNGPSVYYRVAFFGDIALAAGNGDTARVLDLERGDARKTLEGHGGLSYASAVAVDGLRAATSSSDGTLHVWRTKDWSSERRMSARGGLVYALSFSRDGRQLLSGGSAGELSLWDVETGRALRAFEGHRGEVRCAAFSPDGRYVISSADGEVRFWDAGSGAELRRLPGKKGTSFELAMHPSGTRFAVVGDDDCLDIYGR